VIGTGSLVNSDIPPNSFAAGRPARVIKRIGDRDGVE
jgi:acetyltransferase-like isoleucine patch superfamily enzyme